MLKKFFVLLFSEFPYKVHALFSQLFLKYLTAVLDWCLTVLLEYINTRPKAQCSS